jgi:hypothetical protein
MTTISPSLLHETALITLALAVIAWLIWLTRASKTGRRTLLLFVGWQGAIAWLAAIGWFRDFSQPWRAFPVGLTMAITVWWMTRSAAREWLNQTSAQDWIGLQTFRFPLELLLYGLYLHGSIGSQMTFAGLNFDILVGLTAPLAAWCSWRGVRGLSGRIWLWVAVAWNGAGLVLLANIVTIAVLSAPFPFQQFTSGPPNRMVAEFPFIWLPTFFVALALAAHLASLRLLLNAMHNPSGLTPIPVQK